MGRSLSPRVIRDREEDSYEGRAGDVVWAGCAAGFGDSSLHPGQLRVVWMQGWGLEGAARSVSAAGEAAAPGPPTPRTCGMEARRGREPTDWPLRRPHLGPKPGSQPSGESRGAVGQVRT